MTLRTAHAAAILAALRAADLRAYDEIPENRRYPYVAFGPLDEIPVGDDCSDGSETFGQLDIWSKDLSHKETSDYAAKVRQVFKDDLIIPGHTVVDQVVESIAYLIDPAKQISHGIVRYRLDTEPA